MIGQCGPDCLLTEVDADAERLSASAREEGAWRLGDRTVRRITANGHPASHPFRPPEILDLSRRRQLLVQLKERPIEGVLPVTRLCECSFESPFVDGRPLQDFGLGTDAKRLIPPAERRIVRHPSSNAALLADLADGLDRLHRAGLAHGDAAIMNGLETEAGAIWVDLNSLLPATAETTSLDVSAYLLTTVWPLLVDHDQFSPSLFTDIAELTVDAPADPLGRLTKALRQDREDIKEEDPRSGFLTALGDAASRLGVDETRRLALALAPLYFLDQTRSDLVARFFRAVGENERARHKLLDEERTRLHYLRFQSQVDELQAWTEELQGAVSFHQEAVSRLEAENERLREVLEAEAARAASDKTTIGEATSQIEQLESELEELQDVNAGLRSSLIRRSDAEAELSHIAGTAVPRAEALDRDKAELRAQLDRIVTSKSWRLAMGFRWISVRAGRVARSPRVLWRYLRRGDERDHGPRRDAETATRVVAGVAPDPAFAVETDPIVSVIVPVYNKGRIVLRAIESLENQTIDGLEIIVWDDGSTDEETVEVLAELDHHSSVTLFRSPNRGVVRARNSAIASSRGPFVACLDPDDWLAPTYLEKAVALLLAHPEVGIAYPWQQTVGDIEELWKCSDLDPHVIGRANQLPVCSVFRREVFDVTGGYSPAMREGYEDWEFWAHAADAGFRGRVIPEALFEYTHSQQAAESRDATARRVHDRLRSRINALHPTLESQARPVRRAGGGSITDLTGRTFPSSPTPTILLTLPWFTLGGADAMVESLVTDWRERGHTVIALTTVPLGSGMVDRTDALRSLTPYVYNLSRFLPEQDWMPFVRGVLDRIDGAVTVVNVGSAWTQARFGALREHRPQIRIIDHHFNDVGHFEGNSLVRDDVDLTIGVYESLSDRFRSDGRRSDVETVLVGIEPPKPCTPAEIQDVASTLPMVNDSLAVFVGRLSEEKRPQWMIDLAKRCPEDLDVLLIGNGPLAPSVEEAATHHPNLHWLEKVEEVAPYMALADVFVLSSTTEGIPLTAMEALALGTPVVAPGVGGLPELAEDHEVVTVPVDDLPAFIDAVRTTIARPPAAVTLDERFTAAAMLDRYRTLLLAAADQTGR